MVPQSTVVVLTVGYTFILSDPSFGGKLFKTLLPTQDLRNYKSLENHQIFKVTKTTKLLYSFSQLFYFS